MLAVPTDDRVVFLYHILQRYDNISIVAIIQLNNYQFDLIA